MTKAWLSIAAAFVGGAALVFGLGFAIDRWRRREDADLRDARLRERVRDEIAGLVSYSDAIQVTVDGPVVRISGYVLAAEKDGLLSRLTRVPGVHRIHNALSEVSDVDRLEQLRRRGDETGIDDLRTQAYSGA
jgi:hypothetical protein